MKNFFVIFIALTSLVGCRQDLSFSYLIKHPSVLVNEMNKCQSNYAAATQSTQCDAVKNALMRLSPYIVQMQEDPEKFGQSLMAKETANGKTESALRQAEIQVENLQKQSASPDALNQAISNRDNLRKVHAEQQEEIQIMLGIVGLNSPE